jgi:hypothetical protein
MSIDFIHFGSMAPFPTGRWKITFSALSRAGNYGRRALAQSLRTRSAVGDKLYAKNRTAKSGEIFNASSLWNTNRSSSPHDGNGICGGSRLLGR